MKPEIVLKARTHEGRWLHWQGKVSYLREETMLRKKKIAERAAQKRKGQSTVEYIILVAAVIAVILVFVAAPGSPFRNAFNSTLTQGTNGMTDMSNRLMTSRPKSP